MSLGDVAPARRLADAPWSAALALTLLVGLYLPTSRDAVIGPPLPQITFASLVAICAFLFLRRGAVASPLAIANALLMNFVLVGATLLSPTRDLAYGAFAAYFGLSLVYCLDLRKPANGGLLRAAFIVANVLNVALAAGILFGVPAVTDLLVLWYSEFYPALVPGLLAEQKPVLTFATHSLAGFFLYLFFYLNLRTYVARGGPFFLLAAGLNLALLAFLKSNTGYAFFALGCVQLVFLGFSTRGRALVLLILLMVGGVALSVSMSSLAIQDVWTTVSSTLESQQNGLVGRYSLGGRQDDNLDFIARHPLSPVGFSTPSDLFIVDSGPIEYLLRGSLPLLLSVYAGLWLFLRWNLWSRREAWTLFAIFVIFELGFANLVYHRTLFILPFSVAYLNALRNPAPARAETSPGIEVRPTYRASRLRTASPADARELGPSSLLALSRSRSEAQRTVREESRGTGSDTGSLGA